ncbi:MAG: hypothetical protein AAF447_14050 [Myxococcota bacterium]
MRFASVCLLAAFSAACSSSSAAGDAPFGPVSGAWTVSSSDATVSGCGALGDLGLLGDLLPEDASFEIVGDAEAGTFTLQTSATGPDAEPLMCSQLANRMDFVCDPTERELSLDLGELLAFLPEDSPIRMALMGIPGGGSLTFTIAVDVDGTFTSETMGSATTELTVECSGLLCAGLGFVGIEFPCSLITDAMIEGPAAAP